MSAKTEELSRPSDVKGVTATKRVKRVRFTDKAPRDSQTGNLVTDKYSAIFMKAFKESPTDQIETIRAGLPVERLVTVGKAMKAKPGYIAKLLDIPSSNITRWSSSSKKKLNSVASERVLGVERLIGQVQSMVENFGNPEGFDAAQWFRQWSETPNPALNNREPSDFLDTVTGQQYVSNLLRAMVDGVYQ